MSKQSENFKKLVTDNAECWCEDCDKHTKLKEV